MLSSMRATLISRFNPNLMTPEALEHIFVQREKLAEQIVELIRESATTPSKHYTLLIGPRGIGKTHFISLVYHRIRKMDDLEDRLLIAWVREEEWGISSFLDLLLRILQAIEKEYKDRELAKRIESLYQLTADNAELAAGELLKEIIGNRTLLLLMENLDQVFAGLDDEGQKQLRAYLQENAFCTILATAQSLFNGVKLQTSPFYGFFRIRHLKDLTLDEAVQLLAKVAKLQGDRELESFIQTPTGRDRIQTVHYLAGGNPRVYIIFSAFLTRKSLDDLVEAFMAMLDDLTPYYQDRMKCLSPQQRKIVDLLCDRRHAITVKEIAQRCFITHQTASSQLKKLLEMGYVTSESIGRESYYELREPLMRFCMEVKKQRGEPIRLFVDFLRIWYTPQELQKQLELISLDATLEREYLLYVLNTIEEKTEDPQLVILLKKYQDYEKQKKFQEALKIARKLVIIRNSGEDWLREIQCLIQLKCWDEALTCCNQAIELSKPTERMDFWIMKGVLFELAMRHEEALAAYDEAIELEPFFWLPWSRKGAVLNKVKNYSEALYSLDKAIELNPDNSEIWHNKGIALFHLTCFNEASWCFTKAIELNPNNAIYFKNLGAILAILECFDKALFYCDKAITLDPNDAATWGNRGGILGILKRFDEALISCDKAIELKSNDATAWGNRGAALRNMGRYNEALASYDKAIAFGYQVSAIFFHRAQALLVLNRWDEGIAALNDALNRFAYAEEPDPDTGDEKAIICNLLSSTNDTGIWKFRISTLIEVYNKHQVLSALCKGLVESIPALMSEMVSDKAAQTWLEVWKELTSEYKEFQIPLRLLNAAVEYKVRKGDRRVLLELAIEERQLLEPLLGGSEPINMK